MMVNLLKKTINMQCRTTEWMLVNRESAETNSGRERRAVHYYTSFEHVAGLKHLGRQ
jgi:hypothetical protein